MAHLRKNGKYYYAEFYDPDRHPKRKWVTLRTKDKQTARNRLVELERAYARGERDPWTDGAERKGVTLSTAIKEYLKARKNRRPKTRQADESLLGLLEEFLHPGVLLGRITPANVEAFLDDSNRANSTLRTYHTRLKTFFKWCVQKGMIKTNPMDKLDRPKKSRTVPTFLTRKEYKRLLRCIQADATLKDGRLKDGEVVWLLDVVKVAVGTGMRLSELCHMRWSWVNLKTNFITVTNGHGFRTKSGHERSIYVTGEARDVLQRLHNARTSEADDYVFKGTRGRSGDAEKLNEEYVSKRFKYYVRLAKLSDKVHFHTLRHTYASWLVMEGVDLFRVKELLGHADISTTMRYAHLAPKAFKKDLELVFGDDQNKRMEEPRLRYAA